jgi:adenosylcobinamide-phosphate synthase
MIYSLQIFLALLLDSVMGDPRSWPHPVKIIGLLCQKGEHLFRAQLKNEMNAGIVTVILVLSLTLTSVVLIVLGLKNISPILADIVSIFLIYTTVAARDLARHSAEVCQFLQVDDLPSARTSVAMIVGRDTCSLDSAAVCRACVETVAENTVDGVTAPVFWGIVCGLFAPFGGLDAIMLTAVGALLYKAVNTMDSMFGYKNRQYFHFGRLAARLDDVLNFLPARLSPVFLIIAAFFLGLDYRQAVRIFLRDRLQHASPNAGHPEAAVAGALGVRLAGPSRYFGELVDKPYIGDDGRALVPEDILLANRLMYLGSLLFLLFLLAGRFLFVEP